MTDNLYYAMRECAHLLKHEEHRRGVYTRYDDGLDIPPSTYIEVIVRLVHEPDKQVTPELVTEETFKFIPQTVYCSTCGAEAIGAIYYRDGVLDRYYCNEHAPKAMEMETV